MLKQNITYTDFNGNSRSEDFYFNLSQTELTDMEFASAGKISDYIDRIIKDNDESGMMRFIKKIILDSYGEKSADGRFFNKSEESRRAFEQSAAFDSLFVKLLTDNTGAALAAFIKGALPVSKTDKPVHSIEEAKTLDPDSNS